MPATSFRSGEEGNRRRHRKEDEQEGHATTLGGPLDLRLDELPVELVAALHPDLGQLQDAFGRARQELLVLSQHLR
jgi:hypothetical protein